MSDSKDKTIWAIILHWQGSHYTRACLASLQAVKYPNLKILLVDNGSPDQSGHELARQFPSVFLLETGTNLGFSGGCNAGIEFCLRAGAEWIWLLNNDTKISPDCLQRLVDAASEHPEAAALGALERTGTGNQFETSGAGQIDFIKAKTYLRKRIPSGSQAVECEWVCGSNLLLRAAALKEVGIFDDNYFLYFEDTDLCWRLRQDGWTCLLVPDATIEHAGGGSTEGALSYWRAYYYTRNRLLFFLKHAPWWARVPALFSIASHLLRHALVLPFRGEHGSKQLKAELLGLRDYLLGRFGKARCLDWCE